MEESEDTDRLIPYIVSSGSQDNHVNPGLATSQTGLRRFKIGKTLLMVSIWTFIGLSSSIVPPSVDDLKTLLNCNYEQLTYALATRGLGTIIGALCLGVINEKFKGKTDLLMSLELCIGGISLAVIPWLPSLITMGAGFFMIGVACGGLSASGNGHVVFMWGEHATVPVHIVHFGYGVGTIVGPLLIGPFLSKSTHVHNTTNHQMYEQMYSYHGFRIHEENPYHMIKLRDFDLTIQQNLHSNSSHTYSNEDYLFKDTTYNHLVDQTNANFSSHISIPFGACGSFGLFSSLCFFLTFFLAINKRIYNTNTPNQERSEPLRTLLNPSPCSDGRPLYAIQMFILLLFLYILIVSKDSLIFTFTYAIAVDTDLKFTEWQGVLITTTYWVCYAVSRLIFAAIGHFVKIQIMIFIEMAIVLTASTTLVLIGLNSQLSFWLCICAFGFSAGPVYPSGMAYIDRYITMTPAAFSILDIGIGIGSLVSTWLTGYVFQHYGAQYLFYASLGCGVGITLILVAMQILGGIHGDRYVRARAQLSVQTHVQTEDQAHVQDAWDSH